MALCVSKLRIVAEERNLILTVGFQSVGYSLFLTICILNNNDTAGVTLVVAQRTGVCGKAVSGQRDVQLDGVVVQSQLVGDGVSSQNAAFTSTAVLVEEEGVLLSAAEPELELAVPPQPTRTPAHNAQETVSAKILVSFIINYLVFNLMISLPQKQNLDTYQYAMYCNIRGACLQCKTPGKKR